MAGAAADNKQRVLDYFGGNFHPFYAKHLPHLKKISGDEWAAVCPFHGDKDPSLNVNARTGLFFCHGCGAKGDIFSFYGRLHGLSNGDFPKVLEGIASDFGIELGQFVPSHTTTEMGSAKPKPTTTENETKNNVVGQKNVVVAHAWTTTTTTGNDTKKDGTHSPRIVATYDYHTADGNLLFQVCRMEPKSFRQRRPDGNGGWVWSTKGIEPVLYHLPEVMVADEVFLVEGEKDADNLRALGFTATTNVGGAGKWRASYTEALRGKDVVLLPDNDEPGRKHALHVAAQLHGKAKSVKLLVLPDLPEKGDVSDFIAAYDDPAEAAERLSIMVEGAVEWEPESEEKPEPLIYIPCWDNCPPEAEPLVKLNDTPVLHRGNLAMLTAGAGQGKTAASHGALPTLVHADNETLGLSAFGDGATVLDTEHDERLFNLLWQRFMFRCGFSRGTPAPDNIRFKNIRAVEKLSERLDILWDEFQSCQGLLMVDGIGDFVADPNNSDECTALVYRLSSEAQKHDIGVFVTLHNNPVVASEKARGVLGSELWRKAQSTLMIKRGGDGIAQITTEYSLGKNRQNSDRLSAYFCWDDELKMHVACDPPEETGNTGKSAKQQQDIIMALRGEYTHKDLVALVMEVAGVKERQARNKVSDLVAQGVIEKTDQNLYRERSTTHWSDDI